MTCTMPTTSLAMCTRKPRYLYKDADGDVVAALCAQHDRAGGHARMLRPRPWEYATKLDWNAGTTLARG